MNQKSPPKATLGDGSTVSRGVKTARLLTIGQRWVRRRDGTVWVVYQVHRKDRLVELYPEGADPHMRGTLRRVGFTAFRRAHQLAKESAI